MTPASEQQLIRLASDNQPIYEDARRWFLTQGPSIAPVLLGGLKDSRLGLVCHWRILLLLRDFALPSTLPAILEAFHAAFERKDPIVLPGAMEALAVFDLEEATSALVSVLQFGEIDDVKHAAALLGNRGDDRAVEALAELLKHEQAGVRYSAVRALLKVNRAPAIEVLKRHRQRETDPAVLKLMNSKP